MSIKQNKHSKHSFFMKLALMQAQRNLGNTKENPAVGCVIVKNDCISKIKRVFSSLDGSTTISEINNKKAEVHEV